MKAVFMGSSAFALPALAALVSDQYDVIAVYTQPDKKAGRGQHIMSCPVKQYAVTKGLTVIQPENFRDHDAVAKFEALKPDIVIIAAYGQILPEAILAVPVYKCINIHPSLLPRYRGPSPIAEAIKNGDAVTGVTIMLVEKKVDSGPILAQRQITIKEEDTTDILSEKLAELGAQLLIETIPRWVSGNIIPLAQGECNASYTKMALREDGELDWKLPAIQLWRNVKAYHPWPGCFTTWKDRRLKITKVIPLPAQNGGTVGEVSTLSRTEPASIAVRTGDGLLGIICVQPEGKREMTAEEFIAGHHDFIGSIL
ncbi:MAG: methionyl-tRNA formyltransferase [Dehalococcoidia bacterium]|nr:methionyl-tRNA formyltransferase [Dehalococcoidia bacterium]MDD5493574.1 methionyl-tRNA formyltransferase [Dehalococcoidia bacterium]